MKHNRQGQESDKEHGEEQEITRATSSVHGSILKNMWKPNLAGFLCQTKVDFALQFEKVFEQGEV